MPEVHRTWSGKIAVWCHTLDKKIEDRVGSAHVRTRAQSTIEEPLEHQGMYTIELQYAIIINFIAHMYSL